jgi:hypothetical protein
MTARLDYGEQELDAHKLAQPQPARTAEQLRSKQFDLRGTIRFHHTPVAGTDQNPATLFGQRTADGYV